jgi:dolichol kinase
VHSNVSEAGAVAMFVIVYVASWIAWGFIVYGLLGVTARRP